MKNIYLLLILSLFANKINAQEWTDKLPEKGGKPYSFFEIQKAFNDYWEPFQLKGGYYTKNGKQIKASGWKQFKRWEWYWDNRVDPTTGEFPDITAADIRRQLKQSSKSANDLGYWTSKGPEYAGQEGYSGLGRINCIAFVPDDANRFYVGSPSGGLWKTVNGGESWEPKTDNEGVLGVSDIIVIPGADESSDILYIATGDRDGHTLCTLGGGQSYDNNSLGVLKSIDGGATWSKTGLDWLASSNKMVNRLLIHPTNNNILYAATSDGLYKTLNAGVNWSPLDIKEFIDIEFKPSNPEIMYGATRVGGVYTSINGGVDWIPKLYSSGNYRAELAVSPNDPNCVYVVKTFEKKLSGIYKSEDSGENFNLIFNGTLPGHHLLGYYCDGSDDEGGQANYDLCLAVKPTNANILYLGGINTWKSYDGGVTWSICNMWTPSSPHNTCGTPVVHADKHCLAFQPGTNFLFEGNDGGVYKTTDAGNSWAYVGSRLVTSQIYRFGVSQTSSNDVIIGLQDNGTKSKLAEDWPDVISGDGMECIIDYTDANIQYGENEYGDLYRTTNHWNTNTNITQVTQNNIKIPINGLNETGSWVTPYVMHPIDHNTLFIGLHEVWKTTNQGNNWTKISNISFALPITSLAIAPSDANTIYAASKNYISKTTDGGNNWNNITNSTVVYNSNITYITVKDNDPSTAWVSMGQYNSYGVYEIFESPDGVVTWTNISNELPDVPVMCVIQNKQSLAQVQLFAATDVGVYMKLGNSDWVPFSNKLPNVVVTELEIYYNNSDPSLSKLRAATYGRGLWETDMDYDNSSLTATPNDLLEYYDVVVNEYRDKTIKLTNNSNQTITVSSLEVTGIDADQYSVLNTMPFDILPSTDQFVTVRFAPTLSGIKEANIVITNSSQDSPVLNIQTHGIGVDTPTKRLVITPDITYNYGDVYTLHDKTKTFTLLNSGSNTLTVNDLSLTGMSTDDYSIISQPQIPFEIETGITKQVRVRFSPTSIGVKTANLVFTSDADNGNPIYEIILFGNGINGMNQNTIVAYEYWFDQNYANKVNTQINAGQVAYLNTAIPTDTLCIGLHNFRIRYKDNNGKWSAVASEVFYKLPIMPAGTRKITEYEYWFDNGYAAKVNTSVTPSQTYLLNSGFDAVSLSVGLHSFHTRYRDDAGQWSSVASEVFYKLPFTTAGERKITEYEYWFDNGYATKVNTSVTPNQTHTLNGSIDVISVPVGLHQYHIRFRDDAGQWSSVATQVFYKLNVSNSLPNLITEYRYWFDLDNSNLLTVNLPVPVNPYQMIKDINTCILPQGEHTIHFQFKDTRGAWSSVLTDTFDIAPVANPVITANGSTSVCEGNFITLTSSPATSYLWNTGATTPSIDVSSAGNYFVTVDYGCGFVHTSNSIATTIVNLPALPGSISGNTFVCPNSSGVLYSIAEVSGASGYVWTLPNGSSGTSTSNSIIVNYSNSAVSGNITVKGINDCGEGAASSLFIQVNAIPAQPSPITGNAAPLIGSSEVYSVTYIEGISFEWTVPEGSSIIEGQGTHVVTVVAGQNSGTITVTPSNMCGTGIPSSIEIQAVCSSSWSPLPNLQYNMQLVAQILIDGQVSLNPNDVLGAFVGDECRGIASPQPDNNGLVFLTVSSNVSSGEQVELKIWNSSECSECNAIPGFEFINESQIGTFLEPYEVSCGAAQNLSFGQGFTWFSLNVNPGSMSPNILFTVLTPCYDDRVIGQTSFALYTGTSWIGSLSNLNMDKMYRMKLCSAQSLSLMGDAAPLSTINLAAGYTWLGYQPQECQSVSAAMAGLSPGPAYDDRVIGQSSFALYTGSQWIGSLTQMCPGKGYVVKLANAQTLTYPAGTSKESTVDAETLISPTGVYPAEHLQHSMMVVAKLQLPDGMISLNEKDVIYAYIDGEVRAIGHPMTGADGTIFMSIAENTEQPKPITFMIWLDEQQQLLPLNETLSFEPLAAVGELNDPFLLTLGEMVGVNEMGDKVWIGDFFPNPATNSCSIEIVAPTDVQMIIGIFNALGQSIFDQKISIENKFYIFELQTNWPKGLYNYNIKLINSKQYFSKSGKIVVR